MGASGGVVELYCYSDITFEELSFLLHPWLRTLTDYDSGYSGHWSSRQNYVPDGNSNRLLIGPYGDDCSQVTLDNLEYFVSYLEELIKCEFRSIGEDGTFYDVILERSCRPSGVDFSWLDRHYQYCRDWIEWLDLHPFEKELNIRFKKQNVRNWCRRIREIFTGEPDGYISAITTETWT